MSSNQPDWGAIAEKFDLWLPQLTPVGEALIEALDAQPGDHILDVASGTGEPALTLARRAPHVQITGTDGAEGMAKVAQSKVESQRLTNIDFRTMAAEQLTYEDASFDRVLCRFGVMLFKDPLLGLKEMLRVLKPGGRYAYAVWSTRETMTTLHWASQVFTGRVSEEHMPPAAAVSSLGEPGIAEQILNDAGYRDFRIEKKRFDYQFASFDEYWDAVEGSEIMKQQFDALPENQRDEIRDEFARFARDFQTENGLVIPHEYLLISGNK